MVKGNKARDTVKADGLSILFYFKRYLLVTASSSKESLQLPKTQKIATVGVLYSTGVIWHFW